MQTRYILAALRKHRIATFLIALQIALATAVLCNACFLVTQRVDALRIDTGIDEASLGVVKVSGFDPQQANDLNARVLTALRGVAGVQAVSVTGSVPFGEQAIRAGVFLDPEQKQIGGVLDFYLGDTHAIEAFGLRLVAGRLPSPEEYAEINQYVPSHPPVLITQALAAHFWPGQDPLGQQIWSFDTTFSVIGVIDHLAVNAPGGGESEAADWSLFVPAAAGPHLAGTYLVRGRPGDMARIMTDARKAVRAATTDAVLNVEQSRTLAELRARYFESSVVTAALLVGVIGALLGTTALGIVGLASFWVTQRRKQIGIRRALGATRGDILRYFQIENFLIVSMGIVSGMVCAWALNLGLMKFYELPRLPLWYLGIGAITFWILGQLAILVPARHAAAISPVTAIRQA